MSLDTSSNPDALLVLFQSIPLNERAFTVPHGAAFPILIEAKRGPLAWDYEEIGLSLSSACDEISVDRSVSAYYLQPCSTVNFAGDLAAAGSWLVNGESSVYPDTLRAYASNPNYAESRWAKHTRTKSITVEYRPLGSLFWRRARDAAGAVLDLTELEDPFGFALFQWDVAPLPDGVYDLRVAARCTASPVGGEFDLTTTAVLPGVIDRTPPTQFGYAEPADGVFFPGDEVSFSFDADIQCAKPFKFRAVVARGGLDVTSQVPVKCIGDKILFNLAQPGVPLEQFGGQLMTVTVSGVTDLAGNIGESVTHSFVLYELSPTTAEALLSPITLLVPFDEFTASQQQLSDAFVAALTRSLVVEFPTANADNINDRVALTSVKASFDGFTQLAVYFSAGTEPTAGVLADKAAQLMASFAAFAAAGRPPEPEVPTPDVAPTRADGAVHAVFNPTSSSEHLRRKHIMSVARARALSTRDVAYSTDSIMSTVSSDTQPSVEYVPSATDAADNAKISVDAQIGSLASGFIQSNGASSDGSGRGRSPSSSAAVASSSSATSTTTTAAISVAVVLLVMLLASLAALIFVYNRTVVAARLRHNASHG